MLVPAPGQQARVGRQGQTVLGAAGQRAHGTSGEAQLAVVPATPAAEAAVG